jgi:hypothetical protein
VRTNRNWRRVAALTAAAAGMVLGLAGNASAAGDRPDPVLWTSTGSGTSLTAQVVNQDGLVVGTDVLGDPSPDTRIVGNGWRGGPNFLDSVIYHTGSGLLTPIGVVNHQILESGTSLSWRCPTDCAAQWKLVGFADYNGDGRSDPLWYNPGTAVLSAWIIGDGGTVLRTQDLQTSCGFIACGGTQAVASGDFDNDGAPDVLSYDPDDGNLYLNQLNRTGGLIGQQHVSWQCPAACARDWTLVGVGDYNGDGHLDILWNDRFTGQVAAWLLDGAGGVTGTATLRTNTQPFATIIGTTMALDSAF